MSSDEKVMVFDLTLRELPKNQRCRLALVEWGGEDPAWRWLADLKFKAGDESVYVIPRLTREYTVAIPQSTGAPKQFTADPATGFHISLHDPGAVKITFSRHQSIYRHRSSELPLRTGAILHLGINSTAGLETATNHDVNNPPKGIYALPLPPVMLWPNRPLAITLFRSMKGDGWTVPILADAAQVNLHTSFGSRDVEYHVAVWQRADMTTFPITRPLPPQPRTRF